MSTADSTDNIFSSANPEVIQHDFIQPGESAAGGDAPRTFPRQVLTGNSRGIQQFGSPNLFADSGNNYFGVAKNGVNQVLMGNQATFGEGFYVAQAGIDVTTNTDPSKLIFNSNENVYKIVETLPISLSITLNGVSGSIGQNKVPHNLNFIPAYNAYITIDPEIAALSSVGTENGPNPFIVVGISGTSIVNFCTAEVTVDSTFIYFGVVIGVTGSDTLNFSASVDLLQRTFS